MPLPYLEVFLMAAPHVQILKCVVVFSCCITNDHTCSGSKHQWFHMFYKSGVQSCLTVVLQLASANRTFPTLARWGFHQRTCLPDSLLPCSGGCWQTSFHTATEFMREISNSLTLFRSLLKCYLTRKTFWNYPVWKHGFLFALLFFFFFW